MLLATATATTVDGLRASHRQLRDGPAVPRLWQTMRTEWQRVVDRKVAQSMLRLDHPGVAEDYRMARRGR